MSKSLKQNSLFGRGEMRALAVVSLSISLAAFGCTTDRHLGNGDPVLTPGVRTAPTSYAPTGSETAAPGMYSSSRFDAAVATPLQRLTADAAAAIMADNQSLVRVLGPVSPGAPGQGYVSDGRTNQFAYPALQTNPQLTVNSTISSNPSQVITSGAGGAAVDGALAGALIAGGNAVSSTGTGIGNGGAVIGVGPAGILSPTGAAPALPAGAFAAATGTLTPTAASVVNPPPSISGSPAVAAAVTNRSANVGLRTTSGTTAAATTIASPVANGTIVTPVRLLTGTNGRPVITNANATAARATANTGRSQ